MRKEGYYWVKLRITGVWLVAQFVLNKWYLPGNEFSYKDSDFDEIDERRIEK